MKPRTLQLAWLIGGVVIAAVFAIGSGTGPLGLVAALIVVLISPVAYGRVVGRRRGHSGHHHWEGYVSLYESSVADGRFPGMHRQKVSAGVGGRGMTGGRLSVDPDGLQWTSAKGNWATSRPEWVGTLHLQWQDVTKTEVEPLTWKIPGLGGRLKISLEDGSQIAGEFVGSLPGLLQALAECKADR